MMPTIGRWQHDNFRRKNISQHSLQDSAMLQQQSPQKLIVRDCRRRGAERDTITTRFLAHVIWGYGFVDWGRSKMSENELPNLIRFFRVVPTRCHISHATQKNLYIRTWRYSEPLWYCSWNQRESIGEISGIGYAVELSGLMHWQYGYDSVSLQNHKTETFHRAPPSPLGVRHLWTNSCTVYRASIDDMIWYDRWWFSTVTHLDFIAVSPASICFVTGPAGRGHL